MKIGMDLTGDKHLIGELRRLAGAGEGKTVRKSLYAGGLVLEGGIKANIQTKNIIDTGFMLNSVYTATQDESDYGQAGGSASGHTMLPKEQPAPDEAIVAVGADYGIYHEMGTSKMAARPFVRPAVDESGPQVVDAIKSVLKGAIGG